MKTIVDKADSRGFFDHGWLKTYHTFSFADYYNPNRIHFGALRVLNDDTVSPGRGFDTHPHQNMEVISIPLKGYMTHGDSIENTSTITPGDLQIMSTGRGIYHSEYNGSSTEDLQFLQIWVFPKEKDTQPEYHNCDIRSTLKKNTLACIIAPDGSAPASNSQDAWFSLGTFDSEQALEYKFHREGNGVYIFVIEGSIKLDGNTLSRRDGIGIWETNKINFTASKGAHLLFMEVPMY